MIEVFELHRSFGSIKALSGITFRAEPGEILGFLGPNGAGKSTTMRILAGFIAPSSGRARISGICVSDSKKDARRKIGYLPEHAPAYSEMFVRDFLDWSAALKGLTGQVRRQALSQVMSRCGLDEMQTRLIGTLSKGYRQRVGLAQALIHSPETLILDEPFSGLDPNQIADIRQVIREEGQTKTVLFSSHILSDVQAVADRIIIIDRGKLVANQPLTSDGTQEQNVKLSITLSNAKFNDIRQQSLNLASIAHVELVKQSQDSLTVRLIGTRDQDPRPEFLSLVALNEWTLLGLREDEHDLETIFRNVTQGPS